MLSKFIKISDTLILHHIVPQKNIRKKEAKFWRFLSPGSKRVQKHEALPPGEFTAQTSLSLQQKDYKTLARPYEVIAAFKATFRPDSE